MKSNRIAWVDVLNVIACMGVLLLHSTNKELHDFTGETSLNWLVGLCTHSVMLWPVNVFFMLSGYTLIRESTIQGGIIRFYRRRSDRLLMPVMVWNLIYMLIFMLREISNGTMSYSILNLINGFLSFKYNGHMWFFIPLICLYLSMPFLTVFVLNARRDMLKTFILISLVLNSIGCFEISHESNFYNIYLFGSRFLIFAVAGYYLGHFEISMSNRRKLYVAGWGSVMIILAGTAWLQFNIPSQYDFFLKYTNLPCTVTAFAVFVFCRYTEWSRVLRKLCLNENSLAKLSSLSLGIYLVQSLCFIIVSKLHLFDKINMLTFFVMYILCVFVVWTMKHIPIVNKIV